ncbi:hypothetical protein ABZ923_10115 [Streptomyces sp. NPDC046881]|uniref:GntP family permease n=1 Tax=Streptomyces sp. NPDC046881 TaxID=3155374 RepID=UPI0033EFD6FA
MPFHKPGQTSLIALGAMVGRIIELSGGAHAFAHALIDKFGTRRTALALTVAGFILGIPVFFEVGLIILMPIAQGVARAARKPLLVYALPMGAAMLTVHAFLPPHPGPVAAIEAIGASHASWASPSPQRCGHWCELPPRGSVNVGVPAPGLRWPRRAPCALRGVRGEGEALFRLHLRVDQHPLL